MKKMKSKIGITYGSEEGFDVFCSRVDDDVADVALFDLAQHLTVRAHRPLSNVNFHFARGG